MSVIEERLRLLLIDYERIVVLLDGKVEELHGDMLEILLKYFQRLHRIKPWLLEPAADEPVLKQPVLVPATENRHLSMPKGLTRRHHNKERRPQFAIHPIPGTGVLVLRAIAEFDRPVRFGEIHKTLPQLSSGTLGPQLLKLYEAGYLTRENDASSKHGTAYFYSLTAQALDLLTRPNTTEEPHDNGTVHDSRSTSDETRNID